MSSGQRRLESGKGARERLSACPVVAKGLGDARHAVLSPPYGRAPYENEDVPGGREHRRVITLRHQKYPIDAEL